MPMFKVSGKLVAEFFEHDVEADDLEQAKRKLEADACGEWEDFEAEELPEEECQGGCAPSNPIDRPCGLKGCSG